jgi:hypothetical protein
MKSLKPKKAKTVCDRCKKASNYLGALSGLCPACQNEDVASLEKDLGLPKGELGRVDAKGCAL